jgi:hypothetical protein
MTQLRARYANAERGIPSEADHCDLKVSPELCRFSPDGTEGATPAVWRNTEIRTWRIITGLRAVKRRASRWMPGKSKASAFDRWGCSFADAVTLT